MINSTLNKIWAEIEILDKLPKEPVIIGIAGGECTGKSKFSDVLKTYFEKIRINTIIVSVDGYIKYTRAQREQIFGNQRGIKSMAMYIGDHPGFFNLYQLKKDVRSICANKSITQIPIYDYSKGEVIVSKGNFNLKQNTIIVIEGIFALHKSLINIYDIKLYLETNREIIFKRYLKRHIKRGTAIDIITNRFDKYVMPAYKKYIQPTREYADIILENKYDEDI
jgi:uridine kinase